MSLQYSENILVTGTTGVLGAQLVKQLLQNSKAKLYCLVRAQTEKDAAERLLAIFKSYDPHLKLKAAFDERVIPVAGDVLHDRFGLSTVEYEKLVDTIDCTLHVAALTNLFLTYRRIEPVNVGGTRRIIEFALATKKKYLCYVSSHTVVGNRVFDPTCVFYEHHWDVGQGFENMAYQHTKFLAEGMVRDAAKNGLTWTIMRPGQIFGEQDTGRYPYRESTVSGLFYDIIKTVTDTKTAMRTDTTFDVVPVDYVAKGIIELGLENPVHGQTYHLTNPDIKTYTQFIHMVRDYGFPMITVDEPEYRNMLFKGTLLVNGKEYRSATTYAFKWWFRRNFSFEKTGVTDCEYTRNILEAKNIVCPPIDEKLMDVYISSALRDGYLTAPCKRVSVQNRELEPMEMNT